jgi:tRNA-uridine 2-sulfurtransferase
MRSRDSEKDQTYFLWTMRKDVLSRTFFPVGIYRKEDVRKIAEAKKLPTAQKKDSQGICFLGDIDMGKFLKECISVEPGNVENEKGEVVGTHDGAILYTIGERHGFHIASTNADTRPWYIVGKDPKRNVLTVSHQKIPEHGIGQPVSIDVDEWHGVGGEIMTALQEGGIHTMLRYRGERLSVTPSKDSTHTLILPLGTEPVAPGQSAVLYRGEECLGGGIITKVRFGS